MHLKRAPSRNIIFMTKVMSHFIYFYSFSKLEMLLFLAALFACTYHFDFYCWHVSSIFIRTYSDHDVFMCALSFLMDGAYFTQIAAKRK